MISIFATFSFEAAHFLPHVPPGHKCGRMHGHNWTVEIHVDGPLNPTTNSTGWIVDFYDVERAWKECVYDVLDHRVLNDIPGLENPTTETIVEWIGRKMVYAANGAGSISKVIVRETPAFGAIWQP